MRFEHAPRPLRQAAVAALGARNRAARYRRAFADFRALLDRSAQWPQEAQTAWQAERLEALLGAAARGTAHYRGIDARGLSRRADPHDMLRELPVLEKETLRRAPEALVNVHTRRFTVSTTSGSTGSPMRIEHEQASVQRRFALLADHVAMAGADPFAASVRLSGRILCDTAARQAQPWLFNPFENQLFVSTYHLDEAHSAAIRARLRALRPAYIDGYPSAALELLRLYERAGEPPPASLQAIIATAETLAPETRDELARLAGCAVMDYYSASEGLPFIQQCPAGTYHVRWQSGVFEVDDGARLSSEGDGELVVTSFVQDRMPLIRYRTGDHVAGLAPSSSCACGLHTPTVAQVLGRAEDLVRTRDGRRLGMFTYRTLKTVPGLAEAQVLQLAVDEFVLRYVPRPGADGAALQASAQAHMERALGYPIRFRGEAVEALPRGANNKLRLTISQVVDA